MQCPIFDFTQVQVLSKVEGCPVQVIGYAIFKASVGFLPGDGLQISEA